MDCKSSEYIYGFQLSNFKTNIQTQASQRTKLLRRLDFNLLYSFKDSLVKHTNECILK